jgi:hypothetical protein
LLAILLFALSACNLGTVQDAREVSLNATMTAVPVSTLESPPLAPITPGIVQPTPILQALEPTSILQPNQPTPILQSNQTATACGMLRVDVGADPGNTLRLREQPDNSSTIILLIPNSSLVSKVAGSQEVSADNYHWLQIQYTDPNGVNVTGWAARDAMRDRATLRQEGC